jgi:hypothetical protein
VPRRALVGFGAGALAIAGVALALVVAASLAHTLPISCFVVHCEPTRANEMMFRELTDLVALADTYAIPLTIDFTAQWAEMILADDEKTAALSAWIDAGHEIGGHHHAYWATLDRGAHWDGYTNTPVSELLPELQDRYRGSMDDYLALLTALPGERTTACMGLDDDRDLIDWPKELSNSTSGHAVEDCVSEPFVAAYAGHETWQVTHGLILQKQGALPALYEETGAEQVFAVVGHVYNFAEDPRLFELWFRFLHAQDSAGTRRRTVSAAIEEWGPDGQ